VEIEVDEAVGSKGEVEGADMEEGEVVREGRADRGSLQHLWLQRLQSSCDRVFPTL